MCAQLFQQFYDGVALSSNIQEHMDDNKAGKEINWLGMIKQCLDEKKWNNQKTVLRPSCLIFHGFWTKFIEQRVHSNQDNVFINKTSPGFVIEWLGCRMVSSFVPPEQSYLEREEHQEEHKKGGGGNFSKNNNGEYIYG